MKAVTSFLFAMTNALAHMPTQTQILQDIRDMRRQRKPDASGRHEKQFDAADTNKDGYAV